MLTLVIMVLKRDLIQYNANLDYVIKALQLVKRGFLTLCQS